jgi:Heparinase II/III-like protein/Heparinase II/III N-terminus
VKQFEIRSAVEKLRRVATMSPRELAHRICEKSYSQLERISLASHHSGAPNGLGFKDYLAAGPAQRFYRGHRESLSFIQKTFPQWIARAVDEAERLLRHEASLLHFDPVRLGREIDWHRDPVTGRCWERRVWTEYRPENDFAQRDSKIVHELNRHQHLPRLAKAYHLTGDERYAAEAIAQLESWIDQNPPGLGINWQSSLEIGIRTISWLWTVFLLLPSRSFDAAAAQRIGESLFAQLNHIHRHTSLFSSPNTHLIGEAAALFIAGLVFRDQKHSAAWMEQGAELLIQEADKQILDDGVYGELSAYYHCYALDFYLQALVLAEQNHFTFPRRTRHRIGSMLKFLLHLSPPSGAIPLMGDDDGGRALALQQRSYCSFDDALGLGAILLERADFKYRSGAFREETLWLLGPEGWEAYCLLGSAPPVETQALFVSGGFAIQRSGWDPLASHLVFDTGGLGMLTGGHSHADALSVLLSSQGRELLVDSGTYVYNSAPEWRNYFRSTRAHNAVVIDGHDQAEAGGTFRWKTRLSTRMRSDPSLPEEYVEAEHDGYQRLPQGVIHRRRLLHIPGEYWVIVDDFRGSGQHTFDFLYHFADQVDATMDRPQNTDLTIWAEKAGLFMGIYASHALSAELLTAWTSRGYGHRQSTGCLHARMSGTAETSAAMTFLMPRSTAPVVERLSLDAGSAIACACHHDGFTDIAVFSIETSAVRVPGFQMQGEFFWVRVKGSMVLKTVAIRGTLRQMPSDVLGDALCAPSVAL